MRRIRKNQKIFNIPTLKLEGGLFLPDQLEKAALGSAKFQSEADYYTPKGLKLKDDYSRAFQIASAQWNHFASRCDRSDVDATQLTQNFVQELLRDAFGYTNIVAVNGITDSDRHYPVTFIAGSVPFVVAPFTLELDDADPIFAIGGGGSRKKSAFQLAQELLNASSDYLWAIVSNGKQLRLLRDAATLTRPSFLEIDLQDLLNIQRFAEFSNVWRLLHASRAGISPNGEPATVIWEIWREEGQEEGTRVREGLRQGVTQALLTLGEGFLQHPANDDLRLSLQRGILDKDVYFQQLLRLIYRLIFLFSVEERGLLHLEDESKDAVIARRAYAEGYSLARLRDLCLKRRARNRFDDQWQALRIVFKGLANGEPRLALPALVGLFAVDQCPNLDVASLDNAHLLVAMQNLRWTRHKGILVPVDYRNMGPEELGGVYESLLELVPEIDLSTRKFGFIGLTSEGSTAGNARKLSGSYYTPDSLVQELIKSALDPVIEKRLASNRTNPKEALLNIRVIDPACGSGHFLLAAARRLAEKLAQLQEQDGVVKPQDYRHALREVITKCIFGVDRNPMAIELARMALWLEGFEEGHPLSFLDHHLQCGDALLGLTDLNAVTYGIPKDAFKPLSGDDKEICKDLAKVNSVGLKSIERDFRLNQVTFDFDGESGLDRLAALEVMPTNTSRQISRKAIAYANYVEQIQHSKIAHAANLLISAYLLPKNEHTHLTVPTSSNLYFELTDTPANLDHSSKLKIANQVCTAARVFHWPLAFPQVFAVGGFDCVLGNPPWERIKLQEEEFFATRHSNIAEAKNKSERGIRIQWLSEGVLAKRLFPQLDHPLHESEAELRLYSEFLSARRTAEAISVFSHVKGSEGGRFPLTGVGDVNTYALFAETIRQIMHEKGRAGFIVPTGIATDDSTKLFFAHITQSDQLVSLFDIENRDRLFPAVDSRMKFCLLTLGDSKHTDFVCFATQVNHLSDSRRRFRLSPDEFRLINPNTLTCPVFRSRCDAELTKKIYSTIPVFINESNPKANSWDVSFMTMFHMSNDSNLFKNTLTIDCVPLYEAKMVHQFDHRWASYISKDSCQDVSTIEKCDTKFVVDPRYWVETIKVDKSLNDKGWDKGWVMGWRDITNATNERTVIASILPRTGVGNQMPLMLFSQPEDVRLFTAILANLNALVFDFVARHKTGGTHMNYFIYKQLPVLPPERYTNSDLMFIVPRVLELTYTADDLASWAEDLGYDGLPFVFNLDRRAIIRAELDALYARKYGLTRDELRYILDPAEIMGEEYPSETFRVLKSSEMKELGEYRTQRLVMREFDRMALAEAKGETYCSLLSIPPGQQAQPEYSELSVIRNEFDARLSGLILALIRNAQQLSLSKLNDALTLATLPAHLASSISVEDGQTIIAYQVLYPTLFESSRLEGERIQSWLRYFENMGLLRKEYSTDQLVYVSGVPTPESIILDDQSVIIANILLLAVEQAYAHITDSKAQIEADVSVVEGKSIKLI